MEVFINDKIEFDSRFLIFLTGISFMLLAVFLKFAIISPTSAAVTGRKNADEW